MGFQKGQSGNPQGRPRNPRIEQLRKAIDVEPILARLAEQAEAGDVAAAKLLIERTMPALRPTDTPIQIKLGESLAEQGRTVIDAVSVGRLTPDQGQRIMSALAGLAKLIETEELEARIAALEQQAK